MKKILLKIENSGIGGTIVIEKVIKAQKRQEKTMKLGQEIRPSDKLIYSHMFDPLG